MELFSGTVVRTTTPITSKSGAQIEPGTEAMVLAVGFAGSRTYLVETLENPEFEQEVFSCFADELEVA